MFYRPEIDGLRAIAVLSVVFYHAGFSIFPGGFSGVDVFFVISGFLLTMIIVDEKSSNNYSLLNFYNRRVRRLLPVLYVILIFCIVAGITFLKPKDFTLFANSIIPAVGIFSNVFFSDNINYFSPSAETTPLIHIWSLSLEEQFYLIFPLIISGCFLLKKYTRIALAIIVLQLMFMSYMIMHFAHSQNLTNWAFFMMPSRAWELLLGAFSALIYPYLKDTPRWVRTPLSTLGLTLILYFIFFANDDNPWPNDTTLIPTIGTFLFICFADSKSLVGKLISKKQIVYIGLISYSLYLWHQPIFSILRSIHIGQPKDWMMLAAILTSLLFSYITYNFIEKPFRCKSTVGNKLFYIMLPIVATLILLSGSLLSSLGGGNYRYIDTKANAFLIEKRYPECISTIGDEKPPGDPRCHLNKNKNVTWATLGDSHSDSFAKALALKYPESGIQEFAKSLCGPAVNFETSSFDGCNSWLKEVVSQITSNDNIKNVLLVYRHSYYLKGEHFLQMDAAQISHVDGRELENPKEVYLASFKLLIEKLVESGKKVYVLEPTPELPDDIEKLYLPAWVGGKSPRINPLHGVSIKSYNERNRWITSWLDKQEEIEVIKVPSAICTNNYCPYIFDGKPGYFDADHVTPYVSKIIIDKFNFTF